MPGCGSLGIRGNGPLSPVTEEIIVDDRFDQLGIKESDDIGRIGAERKATRCDAICVDKASPGEPLEDLRLLKNRDAKVIAACPNHAARNL